MRRVAVCIPTYRRPIGLRKLLQSLNDLRFTKSASPEILVIVIDNDGSSPGNQSKEILSQTTRFPHAHHVEHKQGLVNARNAALLAVPADFDFVAFVDDDEWVEPQWLDELIYAHDQLGAEAIQGPVRPVFEETPQSWMVSGHYYEVGPFRDLERLKAAASGNCLLRKSFLDANGLLFDPIFNLSGGEDVDFFKRLTRRGATIVAAANAVAYETVPKARMSLAWTLRRAYSAGNSVSRSSLARRSVGATLDRVVRNSLRAVVGIGQLIAFCLISRDRAVKGLFNICFAAGGISGLIGMQPKNYGGQTGMSTSKGKTTLTS